MDTTPDECNQCGQESDCIEGICLECALAREKKISLKKEIEKARAQLRDVPLMAEFPKGIPDGILLGMKFVATGIDSRLNVVTLSLNE